MFRSSTLQKTNMVRPPMPNTYLLNYDYPEKSIGQSEVTLVAARRHPSNEPNAPTSYNHRLKR